MGRTTHELVEANGIVNRDNLRQAVGQLLDYGRFADAKSRAVLVPSWPRAAVDVAVIYPNDGTWQRVVISK